MATTDVSTPENERDALILLTVLTVVGTAVVFLRLGRRWRTGFFGPDDWIIFGALILLYIQDFWAYKRTSDKAIILNWHLTWTNSCDSRGEALFSPVCRRKEVVFQG